jgi:hypothetical protein
MGESLLTLGVNNSSWVCPFDVDIDEMKKRKKAPNKGR